MSLNLFPRTILSIFLISILFSCKQPLNTVNPLTDVTNSDFMGILIFSTECNECPFPTYTIRPADNMSYKINLFGGGSTNQQERIDFDLPYSSKYANNWCPADYKGRVIVAQLGAGDYKLTDCSTWYRDGNQEFNGKVEPNYNFTIRPGVITYAGRVNMIFTRSRYKDGYDVEVKDSETQDIALARQARPILSNIKVIKSIMKK